ncbi:hypothetical protein ACNART_14580 [Proteus sp. LHD240705]|uniref:hypothetical protein n=1 Tax=Proteus TaxID=583 RepID=UPI0034D6B2DC
MNNVIIITKDSAPTSDPAGLVIYRYALSIANLGINTKLYSILNKKSKQKEILPDWLLTIIPKHLNVINKDNIFILLFSLILNIRNKIKKNEKIYIVTHTNPLYSHWLGIVLKVIFHKNIIWISSFTDPYAKSPFEKKKLKTIGKLIRVIEQKITLTICNKIIFVSDLMCQYICDKNKTAKEKSIIIPFYYNECWKAEIKNHINSSNSNNRIKIIHTGNIYGNRDASLFFKALSYFENEIDFINFGKINNLPSDILLPSNITINDAIPYESVLKEIHQADYILVIDSFFKDIQNPYIPSKIVDAMYLDKKIIGITDKGTELYKFLLKTENITIENKFQLIYEELGKITKQYSYKTKDYSQYSDNKISYIFKTIFFQDK